MLWKRKDMDSGHSIYVTTDIPVDADDCVEVKIPIAAYKRLVDWSSVSRTMNNVTSCLADGSPDEDRTRLAYHEMQQLREAFEDIHGAIRQHYALLPDKVIEKI